MKAIAVLGGIGLAVLIAVTSLVIVDETEHVIVTQFGAPVAIYSTPGPRWKLPAPIQRTTRLEKRILFTTPDATELLTADKKNVIVSAYVSWRISEPLRYLSALRTREFAEARLTALVQSELGSALGGIAFTELVPARAAEGLSTLEQRVHGACAPHAAEDFGVELVAVGITRLSFPPQNLQSVFARMRAERARIARGYRSEGKAEAQKVRSEADRQSAETIATADADAARLRGQGEAEAARIYAAAYAGHEDFYRFLRTLETYERVLNEKTTLVLPADSPFLELLMSHKPGVRGRVPALPHPSD